MYSIDAAQSWSPEQLWSWFGARRSVAEALAALEEAGIAVLPLIADTEWQADGVRALHEEIRRFSERCASNTSSLRTCQWELEAADER